MNICSILVFLFSCFDETFSWGTNVGCDHYCNEVSNTNCDQDLKILDEPDEPGISQQSTKETTRKFKKLVLKMDKNADQYIDRDELHIWMKESFTILSKDDSQSEFGEVNTDKNDCISWDEVVSYSYNNYRTHDYLTNIAVDRNVFIAADKNYDSCLDQDEFYTFSYPQIHSEFVPSLVKIKLQFKDTNKDGFVSFDEFIEEQKHEEGTMRVIFQEYDLNKDAVLDKEEFTTFLVPDQDYLAKEEVDEIFSKSDDNKDDLLTYKEIFDHHQVFLDSEATGYGQF